MRRRWKNSKEDKGRIKFTFISQSKIKEKISDDREKDEGLGVKLLFLFSTIKDKERERDGISGDGGEETDVALIWKVKRKQEMKMEKDAAAVFSVIKEREREGNMEMKIGGQEGRRCGYI